MGKMWSALLLLLASSSLPCLHAFVQRPPFAIRRPCTVGQSSASTFWGDRSVFLPRAEHRRSCQPYRRRLITTTKAVADDDNDEEEEDDDDDDDDDDEDDEDPLSKGIDSVSWLPTVVGAKASSDKVTGTREGAEIMPLFPLGGIVYTPNSEHVLNIFEPRQVHNNKTD